MRRALKSACTRYSFLIDKKSPFVTPVPDPRLAKDVSFTLGERYFIRHKQPSPSSNPRSDISSVSGYFAHSGVTLQIDDELITYKTVVKGASYGFAEMQRGAYGTKATSHLRGARVQRLTESYGYFCLMPIRPSSRRWRRISRGYTSRRV